MIIGPCPCTPHARNTCEHSYICFLSYFVARSPISQSATVLKYSHEDHIFYMHACAVCTVQAGLLVLLECVYEATRAAQSAQKSMLYLLIGSSFVFMYIRQRKHTSIQHNTTVTVVLRWLPATPFGYSISSELTMQFADTTCIDIPCTNSLGSCVYERACAFVMPRHRPK